MGLWQSEISQKQTAVSLSHTHTLQRNKEKYCLYKSPLLVDIPVRHTQEEIHLLKVERRVGSTLPPPCPHPLSIHMPSNKEKYSRHPTSLIIQASHIVDRFKYGTQSALQVAEGCCLLHVNVCTAWEHNNTSHCVFAKNTDDSSQTDKQTQSDTGRQTRHNNPTLWTYQV